jgi:hypothetical protein
VRLYFEFRPGYRLSYGSSWFYSVCPGECQGSTLKQSELGKHTRSGRLLHEHSEYKLVGLRENIEGNCLRSVETTDDLIRQEKAIFSLYCDVYAVGNMAYVDNRCYGNG